ncbi:hypothetical protein GCM10027511_02620 [Hymenobacter humi]
MVTSPAWAAGAEAATGAASLAGSFLLWHAGRPPALSSKTTSTDQLLRAEPGTTDDSREASGRNENKEE